MNTIQWWLIFINAKWKWCRQWWILGWEIMVLMKKTPGLVGTLSCAFNIWWLNVIYAWGEWWCSRWSWWEGGGWLRWRWWWSCWKRRGGMLKARMIIKTMVILMKNAKLVKSLKISTAFSWEWKGACRSYQKDKEEGFRHDLDCQKSLFPSFPWERSIFVYFLSWWYVSSLHWRRPARQQAKSRQNPDKNPGVPVCSWYQVIFISQDFYFIKICIFSVAANWFKIWYLHQPKLHHISLVCTKVSRAVWDTWTHRSDSRGTWVQ